MQKFDRRKGIMHNNDDFSPYSNGGYSDNTATGQMQSNDGVFASLYSALFNEDPSPSSPASLDYRHEEGLNYNTTDSGIHDSNDSMIVQKRQDMMNHHSMCLSFLVEASREAQGLREENSQLRAMNRELQKQLSLFFQASRCHTTPFDLERGFRGCCAGDGNNNGCADWSNVSKDPQEISEENSSYVEVKRFSLPESISVRSNNGYLTMAQYVGAGAGNGSRTNRTTRSCSSSSTPPEVVQKVYVRGGKKEEEPLEMVVHNQGMFKTELCNKWQETGRCPHGDHCQFAHGIGELRLVVRHPRYKTEVCRMVLAGIVCPYGHRCHFRHALTEEEKAAAQLKPRNSETGEMRYHKFNC